MMAVTARDVENLNAFGKVLDYDPARLEFVSVVPGGDIAQMENLTVNKRYSDGTAYVNLYNGSGVLATLTMKAVVDLTPEKELQCEGIWLIGPKLDII